MTDEEAFKEYIEECIKSNKWYYDMVQNCQQYLRELEDDK